MQYGFFFIFAFLWLIANLFAPFWGNAYYLENESEAFSMRERKHAPVTKARGILTVQDNFGVFTDSTIPDPILLPDSDYFVPADVIGINLPLQSLFQYPSLGGDDILTNLVYANLRVKHLLEEYQEVQKRAQELLGPPSPKDPTGETNFFTGAHNVPDITESFATNQSVQDELSRIAKNLFSAEQVHLPPSSANNRLLAENEKKELDSSLLSAISQPKNEQSWLRSEDQPPSSSRQSQAYRSYDEAEISLPWIFELPFTVLNYFITHKVDTLIVAALLLFLITMNGSRSRRKRYGRKRYGRKR